MPGAEMLVADNEPPAPRVFVQLHAAGKRRCAVRVLSIKAPFKAIASGMTGKPVDIGGLAGREQL